MKPGHRNNSSFIRAGLSGFVDYLSVRVVSRRLSVVVPVLCMGLILMVASIPADHGEEVQRRLLRFLLLPSLLQNLAHIPAYALLAFLWRWSLDAYTRARTAVIMALVLTIGFGIFQEFYQSLIPGRYASLSDVLSDALGAVLGIWVFSWMRKRGLGQAGGLKNLSISG